MAAIDDILANLPVDQLAQRLGADPDEVAQAARTALPALLGGMRANVEDPGGEASLASALGQHENDLADGPVDLDRIDVADGEVITRHVFGDNTDQVVQRLGGPAGSGGLVAKLLPILAPIVLSYLAKQVGGKSGALGGGILGTVLSEILAGAAQGSGSRSTSGGLGSILGDVLGGLLGAGRKS